MQHIETVTVGSGGVSSITFMAVGDIPADFTDLVILFSNRSTATQPVGGAAGQIQFNTYATDPTSRALRGQGSGTPDSFTFPQFVTNASDSTANTFGNASFYIPNYRSSVAKSISIDSVSENNATFAEQQINAMLWSVTDPITSIRLITFSGNLAEHTTASLYGITAGSDGITAVS